MKTYTLFPKLILCFILYCTYFCSNRIEVVPTYNELIFEAENNIIDSKYNEAEEKYFKVLRSINNMYATDIYNALLSAVLSEDWGKSVFWSEKIIKKGAPLSFFSKSVFKDFIKTNEWRALRKMYSKLRVEFNKSIDSVYVDSLKILMKLDQQEYCGIPSGKVLLSEAFDKTKYIDSILNKLIIDRGFPTEELVGVDFDNDTILASIPMYHGLLRHSYQSNSNLLDRHLSDAVKSNLVKEELVESISGIDNFDFVVVECAVYKNNFSDRDSDYLNFMTKKITFNQVNDNGFILYAPLAIFKGVKKEDMGGLDYFNENYAYVIDYSNCEKIGE